MERGIPLQQGCRGGASRGEGGGKVAGSGLERGWREKGGGLEKGGEEGDTTQAVCVSSSVCCVEGENGKNVVEKKRNGGESVWEKE